MPRLNNLGRQPDLQEGPGRVLGIGPSPSDLQRLREVGREVGGEGGGKSAAEAGEKFQQQREPNSKKPPGKRDPAPRSQQQRYHSPEMGAQEWAERPRRPRKRPAKSWGKRQGSAEKIIRHPAPGAKLVVSSYTSISIFYM